MEDWGDFTLNITVMPPEPAAGRMSDLAAGADDELLPTQPFRKPTLDQLKPKATPQQPMHKRESEPLPLRTGTLHSVAGLPLPRMELPRPTPVTPPPRATLDSLRATTLGSQPIRTTPTTTTAAQPIRTATGTTSRPSSRITPAFGTRLLTPPSGSRLLPPSKRGDRPGAARRSWAKDLLQRFNFDDCA